MVVMVVMVVEVIRLVEVVMVVRSQCWSTSIIINHSGFLVWGPKGPNNKNNFTLCMTMPQAAGKNWPKKELTNDRKEIHQQYVFTAGHMFKDKAAFKGSASFRQFLLCYS